MDNYNGGGSIAKDLQASFKATGIFPFNSLKVIDKLPNADNSNLINDTVTDYLKSQRYPNIDDNARKKITYFIGNSLFIIYTKIQKNCINILCTYVFLYYVLCYVKQGF